MTYKKLFYSIFVFGLILQVYTSSQVVAARKGDNVYTGTTRLVDDVSSKKSKGKIEKKLKSIPLTLDRIGATQNKITKNGKEITIETDNNGNASYQVASQRFPVKEGETVRVFYEVVVKPGGKIALGLLNTAKNNWYGDEFVLGSGTHKGAFERTVPRDELQASLVFRNYHLGTPGQSTFTIKNVKIEKGEPAVTSQR